MKIPFNSQSIFFLSEAQCHLFPSNCGAEVNNSSRRAAKLGQYILELVSLCYKLLACLCFFLDLFTYETESKKAGKASFAYAWVLDETGEERER